MNAITGFAEIMESEVLGPIDQKYKTYAADIRKSSLHVHSMLSDMLDIAKIEMGQLGLEEEEVSISSIVHASERLVDGHATNSKLALRFKVSETLPNIKADPRRLKQILYNLLSNAVKFTPSGGTIFVEAKLDRRHGVCILVRDTGIGMSADQLERISSKEPDMLRDSPGMGLQIAYSLAELHGGSISIESQVGVGTTAELWLPLSRVVWET
jgi:two-component system cell cycle sensor histidine kinase PleC